MISSKCPVCASTDSDVYLEGSNAAPDSSVFGSSRKTISPGRILRCRVCGCGYSQRRLDPQELAKLYRHMDPGVYEAEKQSRSKTAERHLNIVQQYIRRGRLLDVGCASGTFLLKAADSGWMVTGIEPSTVLCERARAALLGKGEVFSTTLEEAHFPDQSFDAITLWDVLEHVAEPVAVLQKCRSLLNPGGFVFVNVPDLESREARLFGSRWPLLLAEHLNYFTRPSLKLCGDKAGLVWMSFGRRSAYFSMRYIFYRLSQHSIPGAKLAHQFSQSIFRDTVIPIYLGESYGVWKR